MCGNFVRFGLLLLQNIIDPLFLWRLIRYGFSMLLLVCCWSLVAETASTVLFLCNKVCSCVGAVQRRFTHWYLEVGLCTKNGQDAGQSRKCYQKCRIGVIWKMSEWKVKFVPLNDFYFGEKLLTPSTWDVTSIINIYDHQHRMSNTSRVLLENNVNTIEVQPAVKLFSTRLLRLIIAKWRHSHFGTEREFKRIIRTIA